MDVYSLPVPGSGGKTCSQIFEEAGCDTPASPSCGACLGGPRDTYARMNEPMVSITCKSRSISIGMVLSIYLGWVTMVLVHKLVCYYVILTIE